MIAFWKPGTCREIVKARNNSRGLAWALAEHPPLIIQVVYLSRPNLLVHVYMYRYFDCFCFSSVLVTPVVLNKVVCGYRVGARGRGSVPHCITPKIAWRSVAYLWVRQPSGRLGVSIMIWIGTSLPICGLMFPWAGAEKTVRRSDWHKTGPVRTHQTPTHTFRRYRKKRKAVAPRDWSKLNMTELYWLKGNHIT